MANRQELDVTLAPALELGGFATRLAHANANPRPWRDGALFNEPSLAADGAGRAVGVRAAQGADIAIEAIIVPDGAVAGLGEAEDRVRIELHAAAARAAKIGSEQERAIELGVSQLGRRQIRSAEIGLVELGADHRRAGEIHGAKARPGVVAPVEIRTRTRAEAIPGLRVHPILP